MFFVTDAWAQGAPAAAASSNPLAQFFGGPGSTMVMFGLMFAIMYFLLIRPQSQETKKLEEKTQKRSRFMNTARLQHNSKRHHLYSLEEA